MKDKGRRPTLETGEEMRVDKARIVEMLRLRGQNERAAECASGLPDEVDTRADADLLGRHGIDAREMLNRLPPADPR